LTGFLCASDVARAMRFVDRLKAGMIWINAANAWHLPALFRGMKANGIGCDGGEWSFDFCMEHKHIGVAMRDPRIPHLVVCYDSVAAGTPVPQPKG